VMKRQLSSPAERDSGVFNRPALATKHET
jgi:hypothetical protein